MNLVMSTVSRPESTIGQLHTNGKVFYTIEQPWRDNKIGESCVPAGTYNLIPYQSPTHGSTYCLSNPRLNIYGPGPFPVGARSYCELHSANWARQLEGCIAMGLEGTPMYDPATGRVEPAVENSVDAIKELMLILEVGVYGHTLTIYRS